MQQIRRAVMLGTTRFGTTLLLLTVIVARPTAALAEPLRLTVGAEVAVPVGGAASSDFLPGARGTVGALAPLSPLFLVGARLGLGALMNGPAPQDPGRVDPGLGGMVSAVGVARLRPFASAADERRGVGLFVEVEAGGMVTGTLLRPTFGGALGWGIDVGGASLAPTLRYVQVVQGEHPIDDRDARLLLLGVEWMFGEPLPPPPPPPPPPGDRDQDGIIDPEDGCPDDPEDFDGFEDEDGCPDLDNDGDGVPDAIDRCLNEPEDRDGFEDEDGCPDPDNDRDGFPDVSDECPNEPEVINGVKDYDGCPDEGLITMIDDRIVLDERVLFDFERSRIKTRARPVLEAIVELQRQHPEWISLRVDGHADARGDAAFNQDLSERRAQNVRDALVSYGIPAELINAVGYGATRLRDMRETEEGHQRNRRVEFVVVARRQEVVGADATATPAATTTTSATPPTTSTPSTLPAPAVIDPEAGETGP